MKVDEYFEIWGINDKNLQEFAKVSPSLDLFFKGIDEEVERAVEMAQLYESKKIDLGELEKYLGTAIERLKQNSIN